MRSLVERVAETAGLTYSDAIRLLVEEALAARAGRENAIISKLDALILYAYNVSTSQDELQPQVAKILDWMAAHDAREQERRYNAMGDDL